LHLPHVKRHRPLLGEARGTESQVDPSFAAAFDRLIASLEDLRHEEFRKISRLDDAARSAVRQPDRPTPSEPRTSLVYRRVRSAASEQKDELIWFALGTAAAVVIGWLLGGHAG
jgi:uncharacterized membrane protein YccC